MAKPPKIPIIISVPRRPGWQDMTKPPEERGEKLQSVQREVHADVQKNAANMRQDRVRGRVGPKAAGERDTKSPRKAPRK